ncbi:MAG: 3-oxoacyl-[acyl-carrier protein] reductase [Labilithrix sp.]|nr:3-oxoacyl-[acyl-carrier protein] reductase [Labilithrix sp.]
MIAVVTGAGRGIGKAIAIALAERGCDVALLGRNLESLASGVDGVVATGRRALAVPCDVSSSSEVSAAADKVFAELGVPDVVVPNAGVVHRAPVVTMTEEEWDEVIDVNLKGTFLVTRAFLPRMLDMRRGRFVAIASISSTLGTARQSAYCAAKWGTVGFVKSLAEELRGTGLQSMCVMPGSVDTDMLKGSGFAPAMQPEDVAAAVTFLALDAPAAMNASSVEIFGP